MKGYTNIDFVKISVGVSDFELLGLELSSQLRFNVFKDSKLPDGQLNESGSEIEMKGRC